MGAVRYRVPYEIAVLAEDVGSGKKITNLWHWRCGETGVATPAYGAPIAGPSDSLNMLTSFRTRYEAQIVPQMSINYVVSTYVSRAIVGKRYATPFVPINALTPGAPAEIQTASPHGLSTGQVVSISGVTTPASANTLWTITVVDPTHFTLNTSILPGPWSGDGQYQKASGKVEQVYADKQTLLPVAGIGGITGDALPLYVTSSTRKINPGVGRHFRGRLSMSPHGESQNIDGKWVALSLTAFSGAMSNMITPITNGSSDAFTNDMYNVMVSLQLANAGPPVFTQSDTWAIDLTGFIVQPNFGSLVRRKPRLTQAIV